MFVGGLSLAKKEEEEDVVSRYSGSLTKAVSQSKYKNKFNGTQVVIATLELTLSSSIASLS